MISSFEIKDDSNQNELSGRELDLSGKLLRKRATYQTWQRGSFGLM